MHTTNGLFCTEKKKIKIKQLTVFAYGDIRKCTEIRIPTTIENSNSK